MKKLRSSLAIIAVVLAAMLALTACDKNKPAPTPTPDTYTVTYNLGGGEGAAPNGGSYEAGATITLAASTGFTKDGYTFDKWNDGKNDYAAGATYTMPASNVIFTAKWKEIEQPPAPADKYTVTYDLDGGEGATPNGGSYEAGATITLAASTGFTKDGYTFDKWNDGKNDYVAGATYTMPASNVTFTAKWKEIEQPPAPATEYTVTFDPRNDENTWTVKVEDGKTVAKPATDPVNASGKYFQYWMDENGEYDFDLPVTGDITLEAKYAWKVTFESGDGAVGTVNPIWVGTLPVITLPAATGVTNGDKTFGGWQYEGETYAAGERFNVTANVTFTAVWNEPAGPVDPADKYTVTYGTTYQADNTTGPASQEYAAGATVVLPQNTFVLKPEYPDYMFKGWYVDGASTEIYQPGDNYAMPAKNVTFKAKWVQAYTVSFDLNGGQGDVPAAQKYEKGTSVTLPTRSGLSKLGFVLAGWEYDEVTYDSGYSYTVGNSSVTFKAVWEDASTKRSVTVFKSNKDDQISLIQGEAPVIADKAPGEKFNAPAGGLTFAHYHITKWWIYEFKVEEGGAGDWKQQEPGYAPGEEIEMPNCNIQLKPNWAANDVTISFDANGGSGSMDAVTHTYGTTMSLSVASKFKNKFVAPAGGSFQGWATAPDGQPLADGTALLEPIVGADDTVTLYAVWQNTAPAPDVTIADLIGHWTSDGHTFDIIADNMGNEYLDGCGVLDGKYLVTVYSAASAFHISSLDYDIEYSILLQDGTLTLKPDSGENIEFNRKDVLTNSPRADFVGKWTRTDTNQPWVITETAVGYGLSMNSGNTIIVGNHIALWYEASGYYYVNVLEKTNDKLVGYYDVNEKDVAAVEFAVGTYIALIVEGTPNQKVNNGSAPDASKIVAPDPEQGKVFDKWVIEGTDTEFDVTAPMTADVSIVAVWKDATATDTAYNGRLVLTGLLGTKSTVVKIVLNGNNRLTYFLDDGTNETVTMTAESQNKPDNYGDDAEYYSATIANNACYILVHADGTKLWICDNDDTPLTDGEFKKPSEGDEWAAISTSDLQELGTQSVKMYFEEAYNYNGTVFLGLQFGYNANLGALVKTIYVSGDKETVLTTSIYLDTASNPENGNWLVFKTSNNSYEIVIGKKSDGNYYVVSFRYKSTGTTDTTERALTGTNAPAF